MSALDRIGALAAAHPDKLLHFAAGAAVATVAGSAALALGHAPALAAPVALAASLAAGVAKEVYDGARRNWADLAATALGGVLVVTPLWLPSVLSSVA